jgi:alkyl sulfatase BDS1-like metallo-beta-lactamase superfamily hydrolase
MKNVYEDIFIQTSGLDYGDYQDFFDSARGFLAELDFEIKGSRGQVVWDPAHYKDLLGPPLRYPNHNSLDDSMEKFMCRINQRLISCPQTIDTSLWRQALLNNMHGLFEVCAGVYQVRGYDLANLTIVQLATGLAVIDCTTACETAKAALELFWNSVNIQLPIKVIIISHTHVDHYGGIQGVMEANQERFGRKDIPIIAPEHFMDEAALENALVGDAMFRRSTYQYGSFLPVLINGTGKVDAGLGKDLQQGGTVSFAEPNCTIIPNPANAPQLDWTSGSAYEKTPLNIDGVDFEFMLCPGTEAPSEMTIWVGTYKLLVAAEIASHTLHNLLTPRGTQVRDARLWWKALDALLTAYAKDMSILCATHNWPIWQDDTFRCETLLKEQRNSYKYLHDQTVRLMNKGYTMLEIAAWFDEPANLPRFLTDRWYNRGYYGTISYNVRAIYQKYLGWFDMNPSNLNPLPPVPVAKKYIQAMGGNGAVYYMIENILINQDSKQEDYRWAAELGKHLVFSYPNAQNQRLLAYVYEKLGYTCEAGSWRNMYLVGAQELHTGAPLHPNMGSAANPAILNCVEDEMLYDYISARFIAKTAFSTQPLFQFQIYDPDRQTVFVVEASNGLLQYKKSTDQGCSPYLLVLKVDRTVLVSLILKIVTLDIAVENGSAVIFGIEGTTNAPFDLAYIRQFFDCMEDSYTAFNIVTPNLISGKYRRKKPAKL